jgi:hypothetical protein
MIQTFLNSLVSIITNGHPDYLGFLPSPVLFVGVVSLLAASLYIIHRLGGRYWAFLYVAMIPFLNWSFGVIPEVEVIEPNGAFAKGVSLHPMTMVTGLVFVVRDFVQREMHQKVLVCMGLAIGWSFFYAWPVIALASGIAFAVSELFDWLLFTFTRYKLSTRILISSAVAAPVDTTLFLYGADLAQQVYLGAEPGSMLHLANWTVFIIGKMIGAVVVSEVIRRRENAGQINPYEL